MVSPSVLFIIHDFLFPVCSRAPATLVISSGDLVGNRQQQQQRQLITAFDDGVWQHVHNNSNNNFQFVSFCCFANDLYSSSCSDTLMALLNRYNFHAELSAVAIGVDSFDSVFFSLFFSSFKSIHEPLCMSTDSISYVHIASAFSRSHHHVNSYLSILRYLRKFAHNLFLSFNVQLCCSGHGLRYSTVWFIHYIPLQHIWCVETNFQGFPSFFERTHTQYRIQKWRWAYSIVSVPFYYYRSSSYPLCYCCFAAHHSKIFYTLSWCIAFNVALKHPVVSHMLYTHCCKHTHTHTHTIHVYADDYSADVCACVSSTLSSYAELNVYLFLSFMLLNIEFKVERRILLEIIGPELQSIYDDRQIEVTDFIFIENLYIIIFIIHFHIILYA